MGFRAPRANERARAFGMGRYLADLGLSEKELFGATGNMFDKDALLVRVGCPIKRWVSGELVPTRGTPTPTQVGIEYEALREFSTAAGARPRFAPVPADMPNLLSEIEGWGFREDARHRDAREVPTRPAHLHGSGRGAHGTYGQDCWDAVRHTDEGRAGRRHWTKRRARSRRGPGHRRREAAAPRSRGWPRQVRAGQLMRHGIAGSGFRRGTEGLHRPRSREAGRGGDRGGQEALQDRGRRYRTNGGSLNLGRRRTLRTG